MTTVPPTPSSSNGAASDSKAKFCQLQVQILSAKLNGVSGFLSKPDVYVELIVDTNPSKKTAVKKKTSSPVWDENFTVLVTESSLLDFKVYGKSKLFEDSLIGQKTLRLSQIVKKDSENGNGKFDNSKVTVNLVGKDNSKAGELKVLLTDGVANGLTNGGELSNGAQDDHYRLVNGVISINVSDPPTAASRTDSAATDLSAVENSLEYHSSEEPAHSAIADPTIGDGAVRPKSTANGTRPQRPPNRPKSRHSVEPSTSAGGAVAAASSTIRRPPASASGKRDTIMAPSAATQNGPAGAGAPSKSPCPKAGRCALTSTAASTTSTTRPRARPGAPQHHATARWMGDAS